CSGDALEDGVMTAGGKRPDLGGPVAIGSSLRPGGALQYIGRVEFVDRQVALHVRNRRMLEPGASRRTHAGHRRQHRKMLGVVGAVELGLVLGWDVELYDKDVGHGDPSFSDRVRRSFEIPNAGDWSYGAGSWASIRRDRRLPARQGC